MDTLIPVERRAADAAAALERLARTLLVTDDTTLSDVTAAYLRRIAYAAALVDERAQAYPPVEAASAYLGPLTHQTRSTVELHG